jgi:hypothetical protein
MAAEVNPCEGQRDGGDVKQNNEHVLRLKQKAPAKPGLSTDRFSSPAVIRCTTRGGST